MLRFPFKAIVQLLLKDRFILSYLCFETTPVFLFSHCCFITWVVNNLYAASRFSFSPFCIMVVSFILFDPKYSFICNSSQSLQVLCFIPQACIHSRIWNGTIPFERYIFWAFNRLIAIPYLRIIASTWNCKEGGHVKQLKLNWYNYNIPVPWTRYKQKHTVLSMRLPSSPVFGII